MSEPTFVIDVFCPTCYEPLVKAEPTPDLVPNSPPYYIAHEPTYCTNKYLRDITVHLGNIANEMHNVTNQTARTVDAVTILNHTLQAIRDK